MRDRGRGVIRPRPGFACYERRVYVLYKLVQVLLLPGFWIAAGMIASFVLTKRRPAIARAALGVSLLLFLGAGTRPLSDALVRSLERTYPSVDPSSLAKQDAIVVLSGGAHWEPESKRATVFDTASLDRVVEGVVLWRAGVAPMIILSGGVGDALHASPPEGDAMRDLAVSLGVPLEAVALENASRTTSENAVDVRRKFPELKRIALVSSASHLARATALFRKQGFEVTSVPAGHLATGDGWSFGDVVPGAVSLRRSESALHEDAGLLLH